MADACVSIMENVDFADVIPSGVEESHAAQRNEVRNTHINIGSREEISTTDLAEIITDE